VNIRHGLPQQVIDAIAGVLAEFPDVEEAILFGSRAKGTHKPGSDIDLALIGASLDWRTIGTIYDALDDRLLAYRFSLIIYDDKTDPEVVAHIQRVGIPIFERHGTAASSSRKRPQR
jgi:predicted nucleotidyltransferase